jgi:hypothetical protein
VCFSPNNQVPEVFHYGTPISKKRRAPILSDMS